MTEVDEHGVERPAESPGLLSQIIDVRNGRIVALRTYRTPESELTSPVARMRAYGHDRGLTNEQSAVRHVAALAAGSVDPGGRLHASVIEASALLGGTVDDAAPPRRAAGHGDRRRVHRLGPAWRPLSLEQDPVAAGVNAPALPKSSGRERDRRSRHPSSSTGSRGHPGGRRLVNPCRPERPDGSLRLPMSSPPPSRAPRRATICAASSTSSRRWTRRRARRARAGEDELFNSVAAEAARLTTRPPRWSDSTGRGPTRSWPRAAARYRSVCRSRSRKTNAGSAAEVLRTHRAARRDDYQIAGGIFDRDDFAKGSSVSVPILVNGGLWGMLGEITENRELPAGTEQRLEKFAELIAAAVANSQARAEVQALADEQSALRRIAKLAAHGAAEADLFDAVAIEAAGLVENEPTTLVRYEGERRFKILATSGGPVPPGTSVESPPDDRGPFAQMLGESVPPGANR